MEYLVQILYLKKKAAAAVKVLVSPMCCALVVAELALRKHPLIYGQICSTLILAELTRLRLLLKMCLLDRCCVIKVQHLLEIRQLKLYYVPGLVQSLVK